MKESEIQEIREAIKATGHLLDGDHPRGMLYDILRAVQPVMEWVLLVELMRKYREAQEKSFEYNETEAGLFIEILNIARAINGKAVPIADVIPGVKPGGQIKAHRKFKSQKPKE